MAVETIDIVVSESGTRTVRRNFAELAGQAETTANAVDTLKGALLGLSLVAGIREVLQLADAYTTLQNKLSGAGVETRVLTTLTAELFKVANDTRASVEATAAIYSRLALSSKELGSSQNDLLDFTKSLNQALILSGATGHEAAAGLLQLSQAIAANRLGGDELRSILEQLPVVADVIAKHMKVTRGELRALGTQGKLTARVVLDAFAEARTELNERFAKTVPTISQSFNILYNNVLQFVGQMDKANGVTRQLSLGIIFLASNFEVIGKAILVATAALAVFTGAAGLGMLVRLWAALNAVLLASPFVAVLAGVAALAAAIGLFGDDVLVAGDNITTLKDLVNQFTGQAKQGFDQLTPTARDFWDVLVNDAKAKLDELTAQYGSAFGAIEGTIAAYSKTGGDILRSFLQSTAQEIDGLIGVFTATFRVIESITTSTWSNITTAASNGWQDIIAEWSKLKEGFGKILSGLLSFGDAFVASMIALFALLPASVQKFFGDVYDTIVKIFAKLYGVVKSVVAGIKSLLGDAASSVGGALNESIATGTTERSAILQSAKDTATKLAEKFKSGLEENGNPVQDWLNSSIEEAKKAAKNRKDFGDMFFPASVDLSKRGKDLSKPPAATGSKKGANEIESLAKQVLDLIRKIDPAREAVAEFEKAMLLLNKAQAKGILTTEQYGQVVQMLGAHFRESVDDAFKAQREFEGTLATMQQALSKNVGFDKEAATRQISKKYPDLFFGTDQEIQNKVALYRNTQLQIQQLQAAGLVTEAQANQMRMVQAGMLRNALIATMLQMAQLRLDSGAGNWADLWLTALGRVQEGFTTFTAGTSQVLGSFYSSLVDGFANSIGRAIVYSENLGDALYKVAQGALSSLISGFIKLGIQWLINQAIGNSIAAAGAGISAALGATVAAAWAPAAAAVSLATFGANAAPAATGISATFALTKTLSAFGFRKGGYTGNLARQQVAGVVHGQEYVMNANTVRRIGVPTLEAIQSGRIDPANDKTRSPAVAASSSRERPLNVTVQNYGVSKDFEVQQLTPDDVRVISRDEAKKSVYKHAASAVAADITNPNGQTSKALAKSTNTERRRSA